MKFSIVIPAYKDKYLREAIESVLTQSYKDFELIILDDASPYPISDIVELYVNDSRVRFFRNSNNVGAIHVVDNWNKCLSLASGEYVICMGDDDCLSADCLELYSNYIEKYPECNLFHGGTEMIDEQSDFINIQEGRPLRESVYSMAWHRLMRKREQYIGDFLFKTSKLKEVGGFYHLPLAWASDDISAYRAAFDMGVVNLPEIVFKYRINSINITSTGNVKIKLDAIDLEKLWYEDVLLNGPEQNPQDAKYKLLIKKNLSSAFRRKYISTYADGIRSNFIKTFILCVKSRRARYLSYFDMIMAILIGLYRKFL